MVGSAASALRFLIPQALSMSRTQTPAPELDPGNMLKCHASSPSSMAVMPLKPLCLRSGPHLDGGDADIAFKSVIRDLSQDQPGDCMSSPSAALNL